MYISGEKLKNHKLWKKLTSDLRGAGIVTSYKNNKWGTKAVFLKGGQSVIKNLSKAGWKAEPIQQHRSGGDTEKEFYKDGMKILLTWSDSGLVLGLIENKGAIKMKLKLTRILKEREEEQEQRLTPDQKKQFLEQVKDYNSIRKSLQTDTDLVEIAEQLANIAQMTEKTVLEETDDWFDKMTINRNMKELKKINEEFQKTARDAKSVQQRMVSLYEDMGHIIKRYFDVADTEEKPIVSEAETSIKFGDKFNHAGVMWKVLSVRSTQSLATAITKTHRGQNITIDNKIIEKSLIKESLFDDWNAIKDFDWVKKGGQYSIGFNIGTDLSNKHRDIIIDIVGRVFGGDIDREDIDDKKYGSVSVSIPEYYVSNKSQLKKFKEAIVRKF